MMEHHQNVRRLRSVWSVDFAVALSTSHFPSMNNLLRNSSTRMPDRQLRDVLLNMLSNKLISVNSVCRVVKIGDDLCKTRRDATRSTGDLDGIVAAKNGLAFFRWRTSRICCRQAKIRERVGCEPLDVSQETGAERPCASQGFFAYAMRPQFFCRLSREARFWRFEQKSHESGSVTKPVPMLIPSE